MAKYPQSTSISKRILYNLTKASEESVRKTSDSVLEMLNSVITSYGKNWQKGTGISPYDDFRRKGRAGEPHSAFGWNAQFRRSNEKGISVQFVNRRASKYITFLFGQNSPTVNSGNYMRSDKDKNFRSAQKHAKQMYDKNPTLYKQYKYEPDRPNQLTAVKWKQFKDFVHKELENNMTGEIALIYK